MDDQTVRGLLDYTTSWEAMQLPGYLKASYKHERRFSWVYVRLTPWSQ